MPERSQRSGRVVIMDDVSWSEPTPQGRRNAELAPPEWVQPRVSRSVNRRFADSSERDVRLDPDLDANLADVLSRWQNELEVPVVIDAGDSDEEQVWGPRPRLMAAEPGGRRTVVITGRVADRHVAPRTRSRQSSLHPRHGFAADRTAMWAVLLCVILLLVAITSH
jgi:hypothetical protein